MNIYDNLFYDYEVIAEKNGDKISFDIEGILVVM